MATSDIVMAGFGGVAGEALASGPKNPAGVFVDASGNVYVADLNNNAIRLLTPIGGQPVLTIQSAHNGVNRLSVGAEGRVVVDDGARRAIEKLERASPGFGRADFQIQRQVADRSGLADAADDRGVAG